MGKANATTNKPPAVAQTPRFLGADAQNNVRFGTAEAIRGRAETSREPASHSRGESMCYVYVGLVGGKLVW